MTDDTTDETIDPATDPGEGGEPTGAPDTTEQTSEGEGTELGNEAARYRHRLRETEGERDALAGQLDMMRRAEVDRIAAEARVKPEALWAADVDLDGLLDEAGAVDREKVEDAIADVKQRFGITDPRLRGNIDPNEGSNPSPPAAESFEDAFRP